MNHGWLNTYHTFSFADYYDPEQMGFSALRVINEDRIAEGTGFPTHPHRDMEIITYVIEGELSHKDSMGNSTVIKPGEVQRMSAGSGVRHSEYNSSKDKPTHLLQIWIVPNKLGIQPSYGQKSFSEPLNRGEMVLAASPDGRVGSISIQQDMELYVAKAAKLGESTIPTDENRRYWLQVVSGKIQVDGNYLEAGDGAGLEKIKELKLAWTVNSEFLLFNLP